MRFLAVAMCLLATTLSADPEPTADPDPLVILAQRLPGGAIEVALVLRQDLPEMAEEALPSGAQVRLVYEVEIRARRRFFWDPKLWHGRVISTVSFDPVIGRYRCELLLDKVIVAAQETESPQLAREWLQKPQPVKLVLSSTKRELRVRARAVFKASTTWLVFPSVEGTDWVEETVSPELPSPDPGSTQ